jgi:hypothetical protein
LVGMTQVLGLIFIDRHAHPTTVKRIHPFLIAL